MELISNVKNISYEKEVTESEMVCEHCGKPYKQVKISFIMDGLKHNPKIFNEPVCRCIEIITEKEKEKREQERLEKLKNERLQELFTNSLITPYFKMKTFERIEQNYNTEQAIKYVRDFIPFYSNGIQMIGNVGTGKTTLLAAICNELLKNGYKCLFTTFSELLSRFTSHSSNNAGSITDLLNWLIEFDFVCLDDIGREAYTDKRKEIAFQIIDTLLNYRVVVAFTANPEMIEKLKQIPEMNAALDRLREMCPIKYEFRGKSLRGRNIL
ncbi:MAG: ATP-binding protein [Methanobrevibacter sp.]|nr:ATP-binding protein [Methanobrevibacter sp.]